MTRARSALRVVLAAACVGVAVSAGACAVAIPGPDHEFHNYQTAVAQAPKQGWTAYWLGRSFEAGGLTFTGPTVADFGDEIAQGGVSMSYDASHGVGELQISLFSTSAWQDALRRGFGQRLVGSEQQTVTIAGATATVTSGPVHNEGIRIDVDLGNTHVLATVGPTFAQNGEDVNTLNDTDAFHRRTPAPAAVPAVTCARAAVRVARAAACVGVEVAGSVGFGVGRICTRPIGCRPKPLICAHLRSSAHPPAPP